MLSRITRCVSADVAEKYEGRRSGRKLLVVKEKGCGAGIAVLTLQTGEINGRGAKPGRCSGFHPSHFKAEAFEMIGKADEASSPARPDGVCDVPICTSPFKNVPVVMMTFFAP